MHALGYPEVSGVAGRHTEPAGDQHLQQKAAGALLAMMMGSASIHAADGDMGLTFEGDSEKFITYEQSSAYENMAPGEERIQQITLSNDDYRELKFYVRSEYTNPLGEGVANNQIAYDIEFSNNGETFYTGKIGGMTQSNMDSLDQNYLLKTLKKVNLQLY